MPTPTNRAKPLPELLLEQGLLNREQLQSAQAEAEQTGRPLKRVIVQRSLLTEQDLAALVASQTGVKVSYSPPMISIGTFIFLRTSSALWAWTLRLSFEKNKGSRLRIWSMYCWASFLSAMPVLIILSRPPNWYQKGLRIKNLLMKLACLGKTRPKLVQASKMYLESGEL